VQVNVRYHAFLREKLGRESELFVFSDGAAVSAGQVFDAFIGAHPEFARLSHALNLAVNDELVSFDAPVAENARVDLLPPYGGG
jgi:molybdopterin converting factor small subunit